MNKVNFYLKDKKSTSKSLIMAMFFTGNNHRMKISTQISIEPKNWNQNRQQAKSGLTNQYEINRSLRTLAETIEKIYYDIESDEGKDSVTPEKIKIQLEKLKTKPQNNKTLLQYFLEYKDRLSLRQKPSSLKSYGTTHKHFITYQNQTGFYFAFENINQKFYDSYLDFAYHHLKINPNTVGRDIKNLKSFLKDAVNYGIIEKIDLAPLKVIEVPSDRIALSEIDLQKLNDLDVDDYPRLLKTRNLFLLQCYTAMRLSDVMKLSSVNIKDSTITTTGKITKIKVIEYTQSKTGEKLEIPITHQIQKIFNYYPDYQFPIISEQKYNE